MEEDVSRSWFKLHYEFMVISRFELSRAIQIPHYL